MTISAETQSPVVSMAFMTRHWSHWLALGFGSGLAPKAPGTAGTVFAWLAYFLLTRIFNPSAMLTVVFVSVVLGVWICQRAADALKVPDHPAIVWDEIAAFWAVLWFLDLWMDVNAIAINLFVMQLVAFGLFRLFDAAKPPPINWLDKNIKGGLGVMVDDIAAAIATIAVIVIGQWIIVRWIVA